MKTGYITAALILAVVPVAPVVAAPQRAGGPTAAEAPGASRSGVSVKSLFPAAGATGVCPDTPLRITFSGHPTLGASGKIRIVDATDNVAVETIDVVSPTATKTIGGLPGYQYHPVIVSGNEAVIYPRNGVLSYNKTYVVTVDQGVFKDGVNPAADIAGPGRWRFGTKSAPKIGSKIGSKIGAKVAGVAGPIKLTVAWNGTGDFCTVQGALDFIPDGNTVPTTIFLRSGTYTEIVFFTRKHGVTLIGEDRKQTVITYANNDRFNHAAGNPFGDGVPHPSDAVVGRGDAIYRRGVFLAHRVDDLVIANLTIRNTTPPGGSQAESLILNGTTTARAIIKDVDLVGTQDTLQINGQAYVRDCTIEGDVDFMWGTGPCVFENCRCRALRSNGYYTQVRNPGTNHGFVFVRCTFDGAPGAVDNYLSRVQPHRFPYSEVVLIDCLLGQAVGSVGWRLQGDSDTGAATNLRFLEINSRDTGGGALKTDRRLAVSRQLRQPDDAVVIANYADPTFVLGNGWNPKTAPIFARR